MRKRLFIASILTGLIAVCTLAQAQVRIGVGIGVPAYRPYPTIAITRIHIHGYTCARLRRPFM